MEDLKKLAAICEKYILKHYKGLIKFGVFVRYDCVVPCLIIRFYNYDSGFSIYDYSGKGYCYTHIKALLITIRKEIEYNCAL